MNIDPALEQTIDAEEPTAESSSVPQNSSHIPPIQAFTERTKLDFQYHLGQQSYLNASDQAKMRTLNFNPNIIDPGLDQAV